MRIKNLPDELVSKAFSISLISHCRPEKNERLSVGGTSKNKGFNVNCGDGCTEK